VERAIEVYAALNFFIIGLSHTFQPRAWVDFFILLRGKGHAGVFANGMLSLSFGSLIVAFHNVWTGLPAVLTVIGWMQILKALTSLLWPQWGLRSLQRVSHERRSEFVIAGALFLALSAFSAYLALRR
jgi:hypothetical protein